MPNVTCHGTLKPRLLNLSSFQTFNNNQSTLFKMPRPSAHKLYQFALPLVTSQLNALKQRNNASLNSKTQFNTSQLKPSLSKTHL